MESSFSVKKLEGLLLCPYFLHHAMHNFRPHLKNAATPKATAFCWGQAELVHFSSEAGFCRLEVSLEVEKHLCSSQSPNILILHP